MVPDADDAPWGPARKDLSFDLTFHQIRHPVAVINSAVSFSPKSWSFIAAHVAIDPEEPLLTRAARYWLLWNCAAERLTDRRYRIEDEAELRCVLFAGLGLTFSQSLAASVDKDMNTRQRGRPYHLYQEIMSRLGFASGQRTARLLAKSGALNDRLGPWSFNHLAHADPYLARSVEEKASEYGYICDKRRLGHNV